MDQSDSSRAQSRLNQSMVSENNRYSKYLDEDEIEVQMVDDSQLRAVDAADEGAGVDEMDDCMYSLNSDRRSVARAGASSDRDMMIKT